MVAVKCYACLAQPSFFSHCARQLLGTWLRKTVNHIKAFNARINAFKMINVDLGIKLQHDTFNRGDCGGEKYN